ncbi:hypothetical protein MTO96_008802 [Rhipicephalus appendiculatus]
MWTGPMSSDDDSGLVVGPGWSSGGGLVGDDERGRSVASSSSGVVVEFVVLAYYSRKNGRPSTDANRARNKHRALARRPFQCALFRDSGKGTDWREPTESRSFQRCAIGD